jgi:hypothetical protein
MTTTTTGKDEDVSFKEYIICDLDYLLGWVLDTEEHQHCKEKVKINYGVKMGARRMLTLKCETCKFEKSGGTWQSSKELNMSLVVSTIASGNGFAGLDNILGLAGIQNMTKT